MGRLDEPPVELDWPKLGLRATMSSARTTYVVAANPMELDASQLNRSHAAPQGSVRLINGEPGALTLLAPGEALTQNIEITFETKEGE